MSIIDLTEIELQGLKVIRNHVAHEGGFPTVRFVMDKLDYKSPRSAALLLEKLEFKEYIKRDSRGRWILRPKAALKRDRDDTVRVPIIGEVACGLPILAEQNIQGYLAVSTNIAKRNNSYYFLRAKGDSMNLEGINEGDLLLVRHQNTAEHGDIVVALLDDEATVKKLLLKPDCIILQPRSSNIDHIPTILTQDFKVQGVVIKIIPSNNE